MLPRGRAIPQCGVQTDDGTKQPDVVWVSHEQWRAQHDEASFSTAPEICVEILSPSNSRREIERKCQLYLDAGALEVWVCDADGEMAYFNADGPLTQSRLCPEFPARLDPFA